MTLMLKGSCISLQITMPFLHMFLYFLKSGTKRRSLSCGEFQKVEVGVGNNQGIPKTPERTPHRAVHKDEELAGPTNVKATHLG